MKDRGPESSCQAEHQLALMREGRRSVVEHRLNLQMLPQLKASPVDGDAESLMKSLRPWTAAAREKSRPGLGGPVGSDPAYGAPATGWNGAPDGP